MKWITQTDPVTERATLNRNRQVNTPRGDVAADPYVAASLGRIHQEAGWLAPDTKLALAKAGASQAAIDKAAQLGAQRLIDRNDPLAGGEGKSFWQRAIYPKLKAASRWTMAALDFLPETAQGAVAQLFDDNDDIDGWFVSTKLGTMFEDSDKAGEGFFVSGEAEQLQAERARRYRGTVNGSAWTLGRAAANRIFLPNSKPYNIMSGVIDAAVLIRLDPTAPLTRAARTAIGARYVVPLQSADEAAETSRLLRGEAGLVDTEALNANGWLNFMNTNRRARSLVDRLWSNSLKNVDEVDELTQQTRLVDARRAYDDAQEATRDLSGRLKRQEISLEEHDSLIKQLNDANEELGKVTGTIGRTAEEIRANKTQEVLDLFTDRRTGKLRVSVETINELLGAGSRDEVLAILSPQWVVKSGSLPQDIRAIQSLTGGTWVDRVPLTSIRKSKFFTQVPGSKLVVGGDDLNNRDAVITVRNWARTLGMSKADENDLVVKSLQVFRGDALRSDQNAFIDFFYNSIGKVLVQNGVDEAFVEVMQRDGKRFADLLRLYYADAAGKTTDGGFWNWLRNSNLADDADEVQKLLLEKLDPDSKLFITNPMTMVESLNRIVYLPDVREVRRLTRSRLMRETINKLPGETKQKMSARLFTKTSKETLELRPNQARIDEARSSLKELAEEQAKIQGTRFDQMTDEYRAAMRRLDEIETESRELTKVINDLEKEGFIDQDVRLRRGELRGPLSILEWYQQSLWKPLALATGGYVVRNTIDAQIRMALSGFSSVLNHPFKYIALVTGRSSRGTLIGEDLLPRIILPDGTMPKEGFAGVIQKVKYGKFAHADIDPKIGEELGFGLRTAGLWDQAETRMWETNQWSPVSSGQNRRAWLRGIGQNGIQINGDPAMQGVARVLLAAHREGVTDPKIIRSRAAAAVVKIVKENEAYYNNLRRTFENGLTISDEVGNKFRWKTGSWDDARPEDIDDVLQQWAYRMIVDRVQMMAGGQPEMSFMYSFNFVPKTKKGQMVPTISRNVDELGPDPKIGQTIQIGEKDAGVIVGFRQTGDAAPVLDEATGQMIDARAKVAEIQPIVTDANGSGVQAFANRDLSFASRTLVNNMPMASADGAAGLPDTIKYEQLQYDEADSGALARFQSSMDDFTDWFFGRLYGSVTTVLDRSPVFRQSYYKTVDQFAPRLSQQSAKKLLETINSSAAKYNMKPARYVGSKETYERIVAASKAAISPDDALTFTDIDDYAKWSALNEVKTLLYNASERNNLEDSLRIVAPFAVAWREILGTYGKFLATNPVNTYRQFQRVYTGFEGADPENDGRGFIYKDPVSGQAMFKFPFSGVLARALTGVGGELEAPISQLSQGISVIPALGPYGQIAVSQLPDQPQYDDIIEFLLPYGRSEGGNLIFNSTPGWVRKALETLSADTRDQASLFYNTYIETVRAKASSGQYDLADPADKQRLLDDSRRAARVFMAMRTASQFFGPTAGTVEFQIPTNQGDQYVSLLVSEFYKMQAEDYDTSIPRFLDEFGDEAFIYVAGKTRSLREGLEATADFGDWERRNQDLLGEYPDVAAYLAPSGSDFSFAVWQRQLLKGERERLTDRELVTLAQERVGSAKYRAMRLKAGAYPSQEIRDLLRMYREKLAKQYPGFPAVATFEVGKFETQIRQLQTMVADGRTDGNPIADAVRTYLRYREATLLKARQEGYVATTLKQAKGLDSLRDFLASIGNQLIKETPEFARIYDRLLAQEVEL
jgi:hypothetical protein